MIDVRVAARRDAATDICSFELVPLDGRPLPRFTAGAHIDVHTPAGLVRQYSLSNDPRETSRYVIGVLKDSASRGGSISMHHDVREGQILRISAPRNHFALIEGNHRTLLLAGGIGITPLLSMVEHLKGKNADFALHYCTRSVERTAFRDRLAALDVSERIGFHHDDGDASQKLDLAQLLDAQPVGTHLYVCGPAGFIAFVLETARSRDWPADRLHSESFGAPISAAGAEANAPFEIVLARSGRIVPVQADQTVARALTEAGVELPLSCEQGVCGTCLTKVLDGEPDHRDAFLTDEEHARNDVFTPCCSRAKSARLVIDL